MTSKTAYKTWTGVALPASEMNTYVRDNGNYMFERLSHYINAVSTDAIVSNTIAETNLWSYSVPGNELTATGIMRFDTSFIVVNNKGTSGTVTLKFYVGANSYTIFGGALSFNNGTSNFHSITLFIRGDGTTSSQRIFGTYNVSQNGTMAAGIVTEGTTATDITTAQTFKLTAQMNAASASFTTTSRFSALTYNLMTI